jgi:hypothetical protein
VHALCSSCPIKDALIYHIILSWPHSTSYLGE